MQKVYIMNYVLWLYIPMEFPFNQFLPQVENEKLKRNVSDGKLKSTCFKKKLGGIL